jgi:hypothetical protein
MNIETAFSSKPSVAEAVSELHARLNHLNPRMVLFFASSMYDPALVAAEMERSFSPAVVFGCSTAGEIISGAMLKNSVVAMAFNREVIEDVRIEVLSNIQERPADAVSEAFANFERFFGQPMLDLDATGYVGIILADGLRGAEETLMEKIGDLTNVQFVGGSAGDDLKFTQTQVYANGRAYTNAAILAMVKPVGKFDFIKTQSFTPTGQSLVPTKVNPSGREVLEFNGIPATRAYAMALGVPEESLSEKFMSNPVGLMVGKEPYVRSPQRIQGRSVIFYCAVREGVELCVLDGGDIIQDTRKALETKRAELGTIQGLVNFHCILRTLELESEGLTEAYGQVFSDVPTIGFSTYGEEFIGHINQTSTMLAFK